MGCDSLLLYVGFGITCFNSRTPCGVRQSFDSPRTTAQSFNSRTPCGVRQRASNSTTAQTSVSIHAPRVGCDLRLSSSRQAVEVSIHAPRVGCDLSPLMHRLDYYRFNSRTPCGVRPNKRRTSTNNRGFQFTHPVWGATAMPKGTH